jgi:hypothetical protein
MHDVYDIHKMLQVNFIRSAASTLEESAYLASIACTLRLRDVYELINFPSEVSESPARDSTGSRSLKVVVDAAAQPL